MGLHLADRWIWDFWLVRDGDDHHVFYLQAPPQHRPPGRGGTGTSRSGTRSRATSPTWHGAAGRPRTRTGRQLGRREHLDRQHRAAGRRLGLAVHRDERRRTAGWCSGSGWRSPTTSSPGRSTRVRCSRPTRGGTRRLADDSVARPGVARPVGLRGRRRPLPRAGHRPRPRRRHRSTAGSSATPRSTDLVAWQVLPPVTEPMGFGQLEVPQLVAVGGRWYLVFCSDVETQGPAVRADGPRHGHVLPRWATPRRVRSAASARACSRPTRPGRRTPASCTATRPVSWSSSPGTAPAPTAASVGRLSDPRPVEVTRTAPCRRRARETSGPIPHSSWTRSRHDARHADDGLDPRPSEPAGRRGAADAGARPRRRPPARAGAATSGTCGRCAPRAGRARVLVRSRGVGRTHRAGRRATPAPARPRPHPAGRPSGGRRLGRPRPAVPRRRLAGQPRVGRLARPTTRRPGACTPTTRPRASAARPYRTFRQRIFGTRAAASCRVDGPLERMGAAHASWSRGRRALRRRRPERRGAGLHQGVPRPLPLRRPGRRG